jgi:HTH-type transcriptional regulator/antitoxin HipB
MQIISTKSLGELIRNTRKSLGMTQSELAAVSGVGTRFIVDLEKGKPTCVIEKTLHILAMLGIKLDAQIPSL